MKKDLTMGDQAKGGVWYGNTVKGVDKLNDQILWSDFDGI